MKTHIIIPLALLLLLLHSDTTIKAQPGQWSDPVNISNNAGGAGIPDMAVGTDGTIHVVWDDYTNSGSTYFRDILYVHYNGIEWSATEQLSAMETASEKPQIALDSENRPHVAWNHHATFMDADIYYSMLSDSGWTEPVNLTENLSTAYYPDICIDSEDNIYIVWSNYYEGNYKLFYSTFDGVQWAEPERIDNDGLIECVPRMVIDNYDNLHLACRSSYDVYYFRYNGEYWEDKENVSNLNYLMSDYPDIAVNNPGDVSIMWRQWLSPNVYSAYYSDNYLGGWSIPLDLALSSEFVSDVSIAIVNNDTTCVLYSLDTDTSYAEIYNLYRIDGIWSPPETFFDGWHNAASSLIVDNNNVIHTAVSSLVNLGNNDIFYVNNQQFTNTVRRDNFEADCSYIITCYPNPFNSSLQIGYNIIKKSEVNLSFYNLLGKKVMEINRGIKDAGFYEEVLNVKAFQDYSSGIYFVKLQTEYQENTQKVIYMK